MGKLSDFLIKNKLLPKISATEQVALQAGTNWVETDIFNGNINWQNIMTMTPASLTQEESDFFSNEVETLCHMVNDWEVQQTRQIAPEVIEFIHNNQFLGLMIPKKYGGKGFSNYAFSTILNKLASRNAYICLYVLIPNSVGPGELIETYGTQQQKSVYLPKLAKGEYVPCFALTEPKAGSDAVSINAEGQVFKKNDALFIRLNFNKRYISMAPVANLIGLAFNLVDPENHLGKGLTPGITCALVESALDGVSIGNYHDPNGSVFPNGPISGKDVVIPIENIIGGQQKAGNGWQMLMEALSGGRGVSLPAQATGIAKQMLRTTSMYTRLRQQFNMPVAKFQGIEEVLTRMISRSYAMEAMRSMICAAIDEQQKPAVASAVVKYHHTEMCRQNILDSMDILAGKAIMRGPGSIIGDNYRTAPIGVTVEGANILTRTLIQFGQGAVRCHPYLYKELNALINRNDAELLTLVAKHLLHTTKNLVLLGFNSLTRGVFISTAGSRLKRQQQKISWASKRFAVIADLALLANGPNMKKRGSLSGRLGDCMGYLLYAMAIVKDINQERVSTEEVQLAQWTVNDLLRKFDIKMAEILTNFEVKPLSWLTQFIWRFTSNINPIANSSSDSKARKFTRTLLQKNSETFAKITSFLYQPRSSDRDALAALHSAYNNEEKIKNLTSSLPNSPDLINTDCEAVKTHISKLVEQNALSFADASLVNNFVADLEKVIGVDDFTPEEYQGYSAETQFKQQEA